MRHFAFAAAALAAAGLLSATARAETMKVHAKLDTATEVPPHPGAGMGMLEGTVDSSTRMMSYTVTYSALTGPATAAHFHGPAAPGANAGVMIPIAGKDSPMKGTATLTDAQMTDLKAGKVYVNVHTRANPGGEIRGQVMLDTGM